MLTPEQIRAVIKEKIPEGLIVPAHDEMGHHYRHTGTGIVFDSVTTQMSGVIDNPHLKVWASRLAVEHFSGQISISPEIMKDMTRLVQLKEASIMMHRDTFEDAGGIGTVGHSAVEKFLLEWMDTGVQPTELERFISGQDAREWAILRSAVEFANDYYLIPVASELLICNLKDKYAGTLDGLGFVIIPHKKCSDGKHHEFMSASSTDWRKKVCSKCGYKATYQLALLDWKSSNSIKKVQYAAQVSAYSKGLRSMVGNAFKTDILLIVRLDKSQAKYEVLQVANENDAYKAFLMMTKISRWINSQDEHLVPPVRKIAISL
jgi:hypothetical protein